MDNNQQTQIGVALILSDSTTIIATNNGYYFGPIPPPSTAATTATSDVLVLPETRDRACEQLQMFTVKGW
ncbi:NLR family CARD domain-containing protein 3-like [Sesbania bispinosa]|nr:NLR family CARD domain-containing protein 3-like [Sesbania bispinosa]